MTLNAKQNLRQTIRNLYNADFSDDEISEIEFNMMGFFDLLIDIYFEKNNEGNKDD